MINFPSIPVRGRSNEATARSERSAFFYPVPLQTSELILRSFAKPWHLISALIASDLPSLQPLFRRLTINRQTFVVTTPHQLKQQSL